MKKSILLITILIFSACSSSKNTGDKWIGDTERNIIKSWGPPIRTLNDGNDGKIFIYAEQIYTNPKNTSGSKIAGPYYWSYEYMYINKEGKIYSQRNEKQKSPPQQIVLKN